LQISVAFHELGRKPVGQAEEVMDHQDLPITGGSGVGSSRGMSIRSIRDSQPWVRG